MKHTSISEEKIHNQKADPALYEWYVEPKSILAHKMIPQQLADQSQVDESERILKYDKYGREHNVWQVSFEFVAALNRLRQGDSDIRFAVFYCRAGYGGALSEFCFTSVATAPPVKQVRRTLQKRRKLRNK